MRKEIQIRDRVISQNQPLFICAEVGVTCNYDMEISKGLIDVAAEAGADAIKFILWFPDEIMSDKSITYSYSTVDGDKEENMFEMLNELRFSLDQWKDLKKYADEKGIILFATVNSPSGIEYAEEMGLEAYKLSSWDYNYFTLWRDIANIGKPMLIDTGPVNTLEVAKVVQMMKEAQNDQSILIHCYHTPHHSEMNMRAVPYMAQAFDSLVGFSATDQCSDQDLLSIAMGSVYLEKRLTLDRKLPGHHHVLSMEPEEFKGYVKAMRNAQDSLGILDLKPSQGDLDERRRWFRHLVANKDITKGTVITEDMLEGKRPESGISPEHVDYFLGRVAARDIKCNEAISFSDV